jgi:hypothetical protein
MCRLYFRWSGYGQLYQRMRILYCKTFPLQPHPYRCGRPGSALRLENSSSSRVGSLPCYPPNFPLNISVLSGYLRPSTSISNVHPTMLRENGLVCFLLISTLWMCEHVPTPTPPRSNRKADQWQSALFGKRLRQPSSTRSLMENFARFATKAAKVKRVGVSALRRSSCHIRISAKMCWVNNQGTRVTSRQREAAHFVAQLEGIRGAVNMRAAPSLRKVAHFTASLMAEASVVGGGGGTAGKQRRRSAK